MSQPDPSVPASLGEVLHLSAQELDRLLDLIEPIESALERADLAADRTVLQNIDLVIQTIQAMSGFLSKIATETADTTKVDLAPALALVKLEATRNRLAPQHANVVGHDGDGVSKAGVPSLF